MMLWTDERIGLLKQWWAEGVATAEIGRRLGCGKNAAVGKAHRLNLERRRTGNQPAFLIEARIKARQAALSTASASALGVGLLQLEPCMCRWPTGEDGQHLFCGKSKAESGPYCEEHAKLAYVRGVYRVRPPKERTQGRLDPFAWEIAA